MGSFPLAALHVNPPQQQPNQLEQLAQVMQLKNEMQNAPLRQQMMQQQVQAGQLDLQSKQQDMAARQALNQAYAGAVGKDESGNPTIDANKLAEGLSKGPAAYQTPAVMEGITKFQKGRIDLQTAATDLQTKTQDMLGGAASAIKAAGYDPTLAHSLLDSLPPSPQIAQVRAQIDNPQALKQLVDSAIQNSAKQRELGASETTANARQTTAQTAQQKLEAETNPQSSLYAPSPASVAMGTAPGAAQIQAGQVRQAARVAGADAAARQPYQMSLQRQEQALRQGDPEAAAQLLISNDATLSELKSRGATPEFITKTLAAAHRLSGGKYNAQEADANFSVAKSPSNVAFFGSSKSLTDQGGTLDQLAAAAKDIPGGKFPSFNSIGDWERAATGNGPIAKYAALALGVADDYAKVMGGGQGSDTSRLQALKLVGASQSPDQRAGSISGIRGAVESQTTSRIGNNTVMRRMYGSSTAATNAAPKDGTTKVNAHGDKIVFKGGQWQLAQ